VSLLFAIVLAAWSAGDPAPDTAMTNSVIPPVAIDSAKSQVPVDSVVGRPHPNRRCRLVPSKEPWSTTDWIVLGSLPVATALLTFADEPLRDFAQENRNDATANLAVVPKAIGDIRYTGPVVGLLWWAGSQGRAPRLAQASVNALEAWTLTQAVTQAAKYTVGRSRPFRNEGNLEFSGVVIMDDSRHSFPSGHTATAWGLIPAYAMEYSDHPWISGALWAVAVTVPASRIHDDMHWLSDCAFSAGVGWLSNRAVRAWEMSHGEKSGTTALILPTGDGFVARVAQSF